MDIDFNDIQSLASFVSEVGEGKYEMAKKKWFRRNFILGSAKLSIWLFNYALSLEQRVATLEAALPQPDAEPAATSQELDEFVKEDGQD